MEYPACCYGHTHAGDAYAVRNDRGATISGLCEEHKRSHWNAKPPQYYHLRTWQELAEREDKPRGSTTGNTELGTDRPALPLIDDARSQTEEDGISRHMSPHGRESLSGAPSPNEEGHGALRGGSSVYRLSGEDSTGEAIGDDHGESVGHPAGALPALQTAVAEKDQVPGQTRPVPTVRPAVAQPGTFAAPIDWWQGAGELVLEDWQQDILWEPFDPRLFEQRFDGLWYLPWVFTWRRLLEAFRPNLPQMVPIGEPKLVEETVCIHYAMLVHGTFVGEAVGECSRKGGNRKLTWASCIEACVSDAITRIGKRLGMNLELWQPETHRQLKQGGTRA